MCSTAQQKEDVNVIYSCHDTHVLGSLLIKVKSRKKNRVMQLVKSQECSDVRSSTHVMDFRSRQF